MIRLVTVLAAAIIIATGVAWLADAQGGLDLIVGSYAIHTSVGVAAGLLIAAVFVLFLAFRFVAALVGTPERLGAWAQARRAQRGYQTLSRGLVAAAAGDSIAARRFARRGERLLGQAPLGLLLKAQAAQLEGDEGSQNRSYRAMLEHPETEVLGLRGLFLQAMRKGEEPEAIKYASRANALQPKTAWASHALFDLHVGRHEWDAAQNILKKQVRVRLLGGDVARRRRAVLLAASARDAENSGHGELALSQSLEAVALAPSLTPAAVLAARKLTQAGRTWKAQDVIEAAWAQAPHPDLASVYAAIHPSDEPSTRARRMQALVQLNPKHVESRLVAAEQAIAQQRWFDARAALEPLTKSFPTTRACVRMAEIAQAERGDATAAQGWLARAARSPRDAQWRCGHCGFVVQDWTPICSNCDAFDSLSWVAPRSETIETLPPAGHTQISGAIVDVKPNKYSPASAPSPLLARRNAEQPDDAPRSPDDPGIDPAIDQGLGEELDDIIEPDLYQAESPDDDTPEGPVRRRSR